MARVFMPMLSIQAAGGSDGIVFSSMSGTWGGQIQTARSMPVNPSNPNTPAQIAVRTRFARAVEFFKSAADATQGATEFVRSDFDDLYVALQNDKDYKGVSTDGRQLFVGGAVAQGDPAPDPYLPQNATTEGELQAIIDWIDNAYQKAQELTQTWRLGFQN